MYSIHNEGRPVVAERFIRTLKTKIYKYMASVEKNVYIDKLDDIMDDGEVMIVHLIVGLIKKIWCDLSYKYESISSKTI